MPKLSLAPSMAHVWAVDGGCRGWAEMNAGIEKDVGDTTVRDEGIAFHELVERMLKNQDVGDVAKNGVVFTDEMFIHAKEYIDGVKALAGRSVIQVEHKINVASIHPDMNVIIDTYFYGIDRVLHIYDIKYGYRAVDPFENIQLAIGAAAVMLKWSFMPDKIVFHIYQPRGYHGGGGEWTLTPSDIVPIVNMVRRAAREVVPGAPVRAGTHCVSCKAAHFCEANRNAVAGLVDMLAAPSHTVQNAENIGAELAVLELAAGLIKERKTSLEEQLKTLISRGEPCSVYSLERSNGSLSWSVSKDQIIKYGDENGVDLRKPVDVITPTQAKALKLDVSALSSRSNSGFKLKLLNNKKIGRILKNG